MEEMINIRKDWSKPPRDEMSLDVNDWWEDSVNIEKLFISFGVERHVARWKSADIWEEHVASFFRIKENAKQGTIMKEVASSAKLVSCLTYYS
jgi:hypothetical protein